MLICSVTLMKPYKFLFAVVSSSVKAHSGVLILQNHCKALVLLKKKKIRSRTYIVKNLKNFFYITLPQLVLLLLQDILKRFSVFMSSIGHVETAQGTRTFTFSSCLI